MQTIIFIMSGCLFACGLALLFAIRIIKDLTNLNDNLIKQLTKRDKRIKEMTKVNYELAKKFLNYIRKESSGGITNE